MRFNARHQPQPASRYVVEWTGVEQLAARPEAWNALSARALEPNPFYQPTYLLASARRLVHADIRCVAVYRDAARDSELLGLFPLQQARLTQGGFFPAIDFCRNDFIPLTAPLIDPDDPVGVWESFFLAFQGETPTPRIVLSRYHPQERGTVAALREALARNSQAFSVIDSSERPSVDTNLEWESYGRTIEAHERSEIGRRQRKLSALGAVTIRTVTQGPDAKAALDEFLRIEGAGWKGLNGTAMAAKASPEQFVRDAFDTPNAEFDVLAIDGKAIAVAINLNAGGVLYTVKTAYDEAYRAQGPGMALGVHQMRKALAGGPYRRIDSCAVPGVPMGKVWRQREPMQWLAFSTTPEIGAGRVDSLAATLRGLGRLKAWIKQQIGRK
ncbi:MAG TPA: GNAT family N-acetyltransferase [Beijerinckiaceae bacterium]|nr:GNAT family N-acetyltransferase [Beijerinckiaceae bacterium]